MKKICTFLLTFGFLPLAQAASTASESSEETKTGISAILNTENLFTFLSAVVVFLVGVVIAFVVRFFLLRSIEKARGDFVRETTKILIGRVVFFAVFAVTAVVSFQILGVDLLTVISALGVGIGFALKDIMSNFIAGVIILTQEKINIGDLVLVGKKSDNVIGTIMDITSRATILHAFDGTEIIVPNADLVSEPVVCYNSNPFRRIEITVGISFDSDIELARKIALEIMQNTENIEPQPAPAVVVNAFLESSVELKVRFWVQSRTSWVSIKTKVMRELKDAYAQNGITIPFPIRTIQVSGKTDKASAAAFHDINKQVAEQKGLTENPAPVQSVPVQSAPVPEQTLPADFS